MEEIQDYLLKFCSKFYEDLSRRPHPHLHHHQNVRKCVNSQERNSKNNIDCISKSKRRTLKATDNDRLNRQRWGVLLRIFLGRKSNSSSLPPPEADRKRRRRRLRRHGNYCSHSNNKMLVVVMVIQLCFGIALSTPYSCTSKWISLCYLTLRYKFRFKFCLLHICSNGTHVQNHDPFL